MPVDFHGKLVVAISSRALFNLDESHQIFEQEGLEAFEAHQRSKENVILKPGFAFPLVQKFLKLNEGCPAGASKVEVLLLSRNRADTGLRVFNSIEHYGLDVTRAAFTGGKSPYGYAKAFKVHLFLSTHPEDVQRALSAGCAAATIWSGASAGLSNEALNFAFDGDAVIFSDESEKIFKTKGLGAFNDHESNLKSSPMHPGPFKGFLEALHSLQQQSDLPIPIRTALVTSRSAPAHTRIIHTLRQWGIKLNESIFLGGLEKVDFLKAFQADIFFDDQQQHCAKAASQLASAHVPYGVANESEKS